MDKEVEIKLQKELSERYGEVIGGKALSHALGFGSMAAMKQSLSRKTLSLPVFFIRGRKGRFALTSEVAAYLAECRASAGKQTPLEMPKELRKQLKISN